MNNLDDYRLETHNLVSQEDVKLYQEKLSNFKGYDIFHKIEILNNGICENDKGRFFIFWKNDKIVALMPFLFRDVVLNKNETTYKDVVSFYGYSGPLFKGLSHIECTLFWTHVDEWYSRNNVVSEFIRFNLNDNHIGYTGNLIPTLMNVKGRILKEQDEQWDLFLPKVRNNYRRAQKSGLKTEIYFKNIDVKIIEVFYSIYIKTMKRNNATNDYYYTIDYFNTFILSNIDDCLIAIVYKDEIPISTELVLLSNSELFSFLGGTISDYFKFRPNDFLKIEVLNWGRSQGYSYYNLGGGRVDNDGLYKYKKSFFPRDKDKIYYTGRKIVNIEVYADLVKERMKIDNVSTIDFYEGFFPLYREEINNNTSSI